GAETMSARLRASMLEVDQTISTWPQLASAVAHGGAAVADAARRIALHQPCQSGRSFWDLDPPASSREAERQPPLRDRGAAKARRCADPLMRDLVSQAILAPSGGNTQPWRWLARDNELQLLLDRTRCNGLIDYEDGGSYLALGC